MYYYLLKIIVFLGRHSRLTVIFLTTGKFWWEFEKFAPNSVELTTKQRNRWLDKEELDTLNFP